MSAHNIGTLDEFPLHKGRTVNVDGIEIAVFNIEGNLYGIQNLCPHKRLPLHVTGEDRYYSDELIKEGLYDPDTKQGKAPDEDIRGRITVKSEEDVSIHCPWHYIEWDLNTGENKARGMQIPTYDIEVDEEEQVWIEI